MFNLTGTVLTCGRPTTFAGLIRSILPALVLVCLLGPNVLRAQEDKLPKAETILDKYVEVTGGKAAYGKLTNRVTQATFEMVGQGLKFSMTIYGARPDKMYAVMDGQRSGEAGDLIRAVSSRLVVVHDDPLAGLVMILIRFRYGVVLAAFVVGIAIMVAISFQLHHVGPIDRVSDESFLANVRQQADYLSHRLRSLESELIVEVRSAGLLVGLELKIPVMPMIQKL